MRARRVIGRDATLRSVRGAYDIAVFFADESKRPKAWKAASQGFFERADWLNLRPMMCEERQVSISTEMRMPGGHGMIFGGAVLDPGSEADPELPIVCWWADASGWERGQISRALMMLEFTVDTVMETGSAVQGFISRCGQALHDVDATPYEVPCRIIGPPNTLRSWATRWLRAVGTEVTWLGESLTGCLPDENQAALSTCAETSRIGRALRVRPLTRDRISALEHALAPVIPSPQTHHEASRAYYARKRQTRGAKSDD